MSNATDGAALPRGQINESGVYISRPDGGAGFEQSLIHNHAPDSPALAEQQQAADLNRRMEKVLQAGGLLKAAIGELAGGGEHAAITAALGHADYSMQWAKYFAGHGDAPEAPQSPAATSTSDPAPAGDPPQAGDPAADETTKKSAKTK